MSKKNNFTFSAKDIQTGGNELSSIATNVNITNIQRKEEVQKKEMINRSVYLEKNIVNRVDLILKIKSIKTNENYSISQIVNDYLNHYLDQNKELLNEFDF